MRNAYRFVLSASLLLIAACTKDTASVGLVKPHDRLPPLTPGAATDPREHCTVSFDAEHAVSHLECSIDGLDWACTRPGDIYACHWGDDPECAELYDLNGAYIDYLCGAVLQERIDQSHHDAGMPPPPPPPDDAGVPANDDAGVNPCASLNEAQCLMVANAVCQAYYCPNCNSTPVFQRCGLAGEVNECPQPLCECTNLDQAACEANSNCHGVYFDSQACACAPAGCCTVFTRCAEGPADCAGLSLGCEADEPHCEGDYVVSYAGVCYEGCALRTACNPAPVMCPDSFPTLTNDCTLDQDCTAGIHQINCCGTDHAIGLNVRDTLRFDRAESICESQYAACECADLGVECDDGVYVPDSSRVGVHCDNHVCTTYHLP